MSNTAKVSMVAPPTAVVRRGYTGLRAATSDDAELVDEARYGEIVTMLGARGGWVWVQGPDSYFGWLPRADVVEIEERRARRVVGVLFAPVHERPDPGATGDTRIPVGAQVAVLDQRGPWLRIGPDAWVAAGHTLDLADVPRRAPTGDDLAATAEAYVGTRYRWGGTTGDGIDCSGLTQQVYRLNGVLLPRDADQQELAGRPVTEPRIGDLLFFGAAEIDHVALSLGGDVLLHAPGGGSVERSSLQLGLGAGRVFRGVRRYLLDDD